MNTKTIFKGFSPLLDPDTIQAKFEAFHRQNPHVYDEGELDIEITGHITAGEKEALKEAARGYSCQVHFKPEGDLCVVGHPVLLAAFADRLWNLKK